MLGCDGDACVLILVHSDMQIESDLSSPGGKARIIHKESDIITAFAINKVVFLHLSLQCSRKGFYTEDFLCFSVT